MTAEQDLLTQYITGTVQASDINKVDRLKVAVCGDEKTGKSNLIARTARKPLLVCDFDDRRESIAGQKDITIKTFVDKDAGQPSAWGELESDLGTLEWFKKDNKLPIRSIALDSMTYLRSIASNAMMKETNNLRKSKIGLQQYYIAQGWDSINYVQVMLYQLIRRLFALEIDVYCVFHTKNEKDKVKSTKENTIYTDKLTVEPQNLSILLPIFNEKWRTYIDSDNTYKLQTKADYYFAASTALSVDGIEEQNIQKLLEKHNSNLVTQV